MNNDGGTMIGVNGGPFPKDNDGIAKSQARYFGPENGVMQGVEKGLSKDWYPKFESPKPRVYHKYYKGCKYKDKDEDVENPDIEDNIGSNTEEDPNGGTPSVPDSEGVADNNSPDELGL